MPTPPGTTAAWRFSPSSVANLIAEPQLDFGHSRGVAGCLAESLDDSAGQFHHVRLAWRRAETLLAPPVTPDCGQGVAEGGRGLGVPRRGAHGQPAIAHQVRGQQGHDGEEGEEDGRGPGNGGVAPLTLRLNAQVPAGLLEGDLNGLIANDKFCLTRSGCLQLSWRRAGGAGRRVAVAYPPDEVIRTSGEQVVILGE